MKSLFKIELFFDETLSEAELKKLGSKIDKIFAEKTITRVDKTLTSRIYYDNGFEEDFGKMWASLCRIKNSIDYNKLLVKGYWYENDDKEDLIVEFFGR